MDQDSNVKRGAIVALQWMGDNTVSVTVGQVVDEPGVQYRGEDVPFTGEFSEGEKIEVDDWVYFTVDNEDNIVSIEHTHQLMESPTTARRHTIRGKVVFVAEYRNGTMSIKVDQVVGEPSGPGWDNSDYSGQDVPLVEGLRSGDAVDFTLDIRGNIDSVQRANQ